MAALRTTAGVTQEELAVRLGIATRNLQRLESGTQNLTLQTIERVAHALGVDPGSWFPAESRSSSTTFSVVAASNAGKPPIPVPLMSLEAAAGFARTGRAVDAIGWTLLSSVDDSRSFLAAITGRSMEPLIPHGAWCLFRATDTLTAGKIGLFQVRDRADPDAGGSYLVKRLLQRNRSGVVLQSLNPAFPDMRWDESSKSELQTVAEWISVVQG